jgi:uncharacterized membrane protein
MSATPTARVSYGVRLAPGSRRVLLTVHIAGGVGLVGVGVVLVALGTNGLLGAAPSTIYPAMYLVARAALLPLVLIALVTGALQAALTEYGTLKHGWVTAKLAITSLLTVAAVALVLPGLGRAAAAATAQDGHVTDTQRVVATVMPAIASMLLLLNVALGVFKPRRVQRGAVPTRDSQPQSPTSLSLEPR